MLGDLAAKSGAVSGKCLFLNTLLSSAANARLMSVVSGKSGQCVPDPSTIRKHCAAYESSDSTRHEPEAVISQLHPFSGSSLERIIGPGATEDG